MKKIYLLLVFSCAYINLYAQTAASYGFSAFSSTYTSISGTGTSVSIICDDCSVCSIPIGFSFSYCGSSYTNLAACSNGWLSLPNNCFYATYTNLLSGIGSISGGAGFLMPYWDDLEGSYSGCSPASHAYYQTTGVAPNRVFTFEWKDFNAFPWGGVFTCGRMNMQVKLYETSNIIDFCYGNTLTYSGMSATIGIANSSTDYQTLNNNSAAPTPSSTTFYTTSITNCPAANQVYRWANACSGTPAAGTVSATVTTGCGSYTSVLTLTGASSGTGITYQWQSSPDGITWTNIPGATTLTYTATITANTYYRVVVTCTSSGSTATTTSIELFFNPIPVAIAGNVPLCPGSSIVLTDATTGGVWTSGSTGIATVGYSTGVVTGVATTGGTAVITYSIPASGCLITTIVTVNPLPAAITGPSAICLGNTGAFTDATTGGTWGSSVTSVASISGTGVATSGSVGTTIISYTLPTGCFDTAILNVLPLPGTITGAASVCSGLTTTLSNAVTGGTWSSVNPTIASITTGGIVTGGTPGTTTISYTFGICASTITVTVNSSPLPITGAANVCLGSSVTLADATTGGVWSESNATIAPISISGVVYGAVIGTDTITYTSTVTGCYVTRVETVNGLPSSISGPTNVCVGASISLTDGITGGSWSASNSTASIVSGTGVATGVSAGVDTITYSLPAGCKTAMLLTVNPVPAPITGTPNVCVGSSVTLADITTGCTWSGGGSFATVGTTTGIVNGFSSGTTNITYTITATGCRTILPFTVNQLPAPIAGTTNICLGAASTLTDAVTGGTWYSDNASVATIGSTSGVLFGSSIGFTNITYTITATGCITTQLASVSSFPLPVTGINHVCVGSTTTLYDATTGRPWSSGNTAIATVDSFTGIVTGVSAGTVTLTYGTGCNATQLVTVYPLPAPITGTNFACAFGGSTALSDATTGGIWSSSNAVMATVTTGGIVTSHISGLVIISYTLPSTGCLMTEPVTIEPLPSLIYGIDSICRGNSTTLHDSTAGGRFTSSYSAIATIDSISGFMTGVSAGSAFITYTLIGTGCLRIMPVYIKPLITAGLTISVSPNDTICAGDLATYTANPINGGTVPAYQWYTGSTAIAGATNSTYSTHPANGSNYHCHIISNADCAVPNNATSANISMTVTDTTNPVVHLHSFPGDATHDTICVGTIDSFWVTDTLGGTSPVFIWSVNWVPVATGTKNYVYSPYNGDIVTCKMISSSSCPRPDTASAIDTMVVKDYHTPTVSLSSSGGIKTCQGSPVTITAYSMWGGWGPSYTWSVNGTVVGASSDQYHYYPQDGDSVACVVLSNYNCDTPSNIAVSSIKMSVDPVINVTITGHPGTLVTAGAYDTLFAQVINGGVSPHYQWKVNGMPLIGENSAWLVRNDFVNDDSVSCEVTTGSGTPCEGVIGFHWMVLVVGEAGVAQINNDISNIGLMPNPNSGSFTIEGNISGTNRELTFEITDVIGQIVYSETVPVHNGKLSKEIVLDEKVAAGVYLLHLVSENENHVVRFTVNK